VELLHKDGCELPAPLGKVSDYSGRFVLRLEPALHRRLAGKALALAKA
jgi:predicted HicB family RNase H-like nuclease